MEYTQVVLLLQAYFKPRIQNFLVISKNRQTNKHRVHKYYAHLFLQLLKTKAYSEAWSKYVPEKGFDQLHSISTSKFAEDLITKITEREKNTIKNFTAIVLSSKGSPVSWQSVIDKADYFLLSVAGKLALIFPSLEGRTSNENKI